MSERLMIRAARNTRCCSTRPARVKPPALPPLIAGAGAGAFVSIRKRTASDHILGIDHAPFAVQLLADTGRTGLRRNVLHHGETSCWSNTECRELSAADEAMWDRMHQRTSRPKVPVDSAKN